MVQLERISARPLISWGFGTYARKIREEGCLRNVEVTQQDPLEALRHGKTPLRVLDPMSGSGTVLAVARAKGHRAFGIDLDPLAVLLGTVWTGTADAQLVNSTAGAVLRRAKATFRLGASGDAYPAGSDDETRKFIRYWFDDYARRQLASLAAAIRRVQNETMRNVLWCGFSRLIVTKQAGASLAMDLSHSRPHKVFGRAPIKPFKRFISAVQMVASNCHQPIGGKIGPTTVVKCGDARQMGIDNSSIDIVLTSPPYLNGIDYMRCSKFSLVWMGYNISELREIRGASVGAERSSEEALDALWVQSVINHLRLKPTLSTHDYAILARYVWDMGQTLAETSRVLRRGGRAVYVVGESMIKGTFIPNSLIVTALGFNHGLVLVSRQSRALPANRRYLPPPQRQKKMAMMDSRLRREVVVVFKKP
jgi:hypothetical protein